MTPRKVNPCQLLLAQDTGHGRHEAVLVDSVCPGSYGTQRLLSVPRCQYNAWTQF